METKTRFFQKPNGDFFVFGPRGTGKSTWLKQHLKNPLFIDLLKPEDYRLYSARPERLIEVVEAQKSGTTIVVDEIQKVPQLLDVVHLLMERQRRMAVCPDRFQRKEVETCCFGLSERLSRSTGLAAL